MSFELWQKLPKHLLRMKYEAWCKLDLDVKHLIVELAGKQKFKCALCNQNHALEVEHEHEPKEKVPYTIYNVRGLVCRKCNWQLMFYEITERGGDIYWENLTSSNLSSDDYGCYIYIYECRVRASHEALLEKRVPNYWHRRLLLDRFDDWYYEGGEPPLWYRKYKEKESRKIETPEDFVRGLTAIVNFVSEQFKKDPNFEPPEIFWKLMDRVQPIIDEAIATRNRLRTSPT